MKATLLSHLLQLSTFVVFVNCSERLLKVPKIYNALITSNEELLPSQAYPAVAPVIHPSPGSIYIPTQSFEYRQAEPVNAPVQAPAPPPTLLPELPAPRTNIKNYQPINPDIPDVPPPPLPMRAGPKRINDQTYSK
ncbi:hypothetical protein GE061_000688 [Apolygus lucorum]|uniref:DUF4794 domain-containing protein n=1 Tax=Apolygus lucorum TaxID=248454 RepID=A0A6A4KAR0_APOLU|nr:hypothetical protein GE061_000688 [Apolygus lucorum]